MMQKESLKSGFVAIVGKPNVGKSSILNALIGQKVSIVSPKPQTTRSRIMGILTKGKTQIVFLDTPGIHKAKNQLDKYMGKAINQSVNSVDAILFVADATKPSIEQSVLNNLTCKNVPIILALNKIDLIKEKSRLFEIISDFSKLVDFKAIVPISALKRDGLDVLFSEIEKCIPFERHTFAEDEITDQPVRVMVSEIVREKILKNLDKEIPHGVAVCVEKMKSRADLDNMIDIDIIIYCEKMSHKGIIIGKGGYMLKKIGTNARHDIEKLLDAKVNLKLWVKVKEDWRNSLYSLKGFGYDQRNFD